MADKQRHSTHNHITPTSPPPSPWSRSKRSARTPPHQFYNLPAPIRVFPFPSLTNNPISIVYLVFSWLGQVFSPPPAEPSVIHTAYWSHDIRSIIVTDEKSMIDLWRQGFFGKGNLSRSEPNWVRREKSRLGLIQDRVSEVETEKRRAERDRVKWERARAEQAALEQERLNEALLVSETVNSKVHTPAPIGPLELLALPNSLADLDSPNARIPSACGGGFGGAYASKDREGSSGRDGDESTSKASKLVPLKRPKIVSFLPNGESTDFLHTDLSAPSGFVLPSSQKTSHGTYGTSDRKGYPTTTATEDEQMRGLSDSRADVAVINKEHLQLLPEEALFLAFAFGALKVADSATQATLSTAELLRLLRQNSYFPPRLSSRDLQPDDPLLVQYAVYHHFRSLGWVPRPGVKFGVDWLLYKRGPVFDHAEYGVLVFPSYADPYWKTAGRKPPHKSWHWLMGVNRVLSKVYKTCILVYVAIPPPSAFEENGTPKGGMLELLMRYHIREHIMKRWSLNRNRD